jgi:flavin-dependent dehydrogenase
MLTKQNKLTLEENSNVGVVGAGPAGSFFSYFLLDIAERIDMKINVDIYEVKDFDVTGPQGCNKCAGIISESLVQTLASEGINLPQTVVKTGIDSYVLHTDTGSVEINTPLQETRIATVYRGIGPSGITDTDWKSFDNYLLEIAKEKGANEIHERVIELNWQGVLPQIKTRSGNSQVYDLVVIAGGVNASTAKLVNGVDVDYKLPKTTKTSINEFYLGKKNVDRYFGNTVHVFLLDIPRVDFAMFIPKIEFVTFCMLGTDIDNDLIRMTLESSEVRNCLPPDWQMPDNYCHCDPRAAISDAIHLYSDRVIALGDCGVTRLYKDGIGAAYKAAKAAAVGAIFDGISIADLKLHYGTTCQAISRDNRFGKIVFAVTRIIQRKRFMRHGVIKTITNEQKKKKGTLYLSTILWDTFTGSAPYRDVFIRTLSPIGLIRLLGNMLISLISFGKK